MSLFKLFPIVILITVVSCSDPCKKAFDKTVECAHSEALKKALRGHKDLSLKLCSAFKDEVKKCIGIENCVAFSTCMEKATHPLRGVRKKSHKKDREIKSLKEQRKEKLNDKKY